MSDIHLGERLLKLEARNAKLVEWLELIRWDAVVMTSKESNEYNIRTIRSHVNKALKEVDRL